MADLMSYTSLTAILSRGAYLLPQVTAFTSSESPDAPAAFSRTIVTACDETHSLTLTIPTDANVSARLGATSGHRIGSESWPAARRGVSGGSISRLGHCLTYDR